MLDVKFQNASSSKEALFYSKLALLDLCGWIEESMDDLVLRCANKRLKKTANRNYVKDRIVGPTYGFDYERHFRNMLIQLIGIINVEKLEKKVDATKKDALTRNLSTLKKARNPEAHTHLKGVTRTINAPSITLSQFSAVYDGLKEYERVVRSSSW